MPIYLSNNPAKIGRTRAKKLFPILPPKNIQNEFYRLLRGNLQYVADDLKKELTWLASNATPDEANKYIQGLRRKWQELYNQQAPNWIEKWLSAVNANSKSQLEKKIALALGIDRTAIFDDENIKGVAEWATDESTLLIRTIPAEYFNKVQSAVLQNFQQIPFEHGGSLTDEIERIYGISRERARTIARDQTSKLNTSFTEYRNKNIGLSSYYWRTAGDQRVVGNPFGVHPKGNRVHGNHYERNGKIFRWDEPPEDGHPGYAINCRCYAEPIINLEELKTI